ncbi:MAG: hypothetical protein J6N72_03805, partial [Psychrobacter sp.]|nr:hypothetical protein [Psychrobacter sp.]
MVILYEEIAEDKENPNHNVERLAKREALFLIHVKMKTLKRIKKIGDILCLALLTLWALLLIITSKKLALIPGLESTLGFDPFVLVVGVSLIGLPIATGTTLLAFRLNYLRRTGLKLIDDIKQFEQ